jgi:hypothetical protein
MAGPERLDKDRLNVLLCYSHLAATAAVRFANKGFSIMDLEGAFKGWKEHNLPVVADEPTLQELREQIERPSRSLLRFATIFASGFTLPASTPKRNGTNWKDGS